MYPIGALMLSLGLTLLAIGSWIAGKLPRWQPIVWGISTSVGFIRYFIPDLNLLFLISGVLFGIGFSGAGLTIARKPTALSGTTGNL